MTSEPPKSPGHAGPVAVTGAGGTIGTTLIRELSDRYDLVLIDRSAASDGWLAADLADLEGLTRAFAGCRAVVHLAAATDVAAPWEEVLPSNIIGTYHVFEAARHAGVERVVFASSNHVVGMFEATSGPSLYHVDDPRTIDHREEVRPDSLYGTSKVFGEAVGRYYAERYAMSVVCLRIGSVLPDDDPDGPSVGEGSGWLNLSVADRYRRLRATWLSQRDCGRLFASALDAEIGWAVVFGTSANPRRIWDLDHAREAIGFEPLDSAPDWLGERPR
jgi:NAD+ dependent glucose-6-phosphate dehydrogenase